MPDIEELTPPCCHQDCGLPVSALMGGRWYCLRHLRDRAQELEAALEAWAKWWNAGDENTPDDVPQPMAPIEQTCAALDQQPSYVERMRELANSVKERNERIHGQSE